MCTWACFRGSEGHASEITYDQRLRVTALNGVFSDSCTEYIGVASSPAVIGVNTLLQH